MRLAPVTALLITVSVSACGSDGSGPSPGPDPAPVAAQLVFTVQPSASTAGQVIAPPVQVSVHDASATLVAGADNAITLELQNSRSGAALSGTTTVSAARGIATFSDLRISEPGTGYILRASSITLTGATSAGFDVSPVPGLATTIAPMAGENQTATVGQAVTTNPLVRVTDGLGVPVANVAVTFSVGAGGGSAIGVDQTTDGHGVATVGGWTLGTAAGANTLLATAPGLDGNPATFTATAVAGPAVALTLDAGDNQDASVRSPVDPPSVLVTDAYGNPVAGVTVTFAVTSGGGRITDAIQTTGSDGIAAVGSWTLGNRLGLNTLRATSAGLSGSPVTFTARATEWPSAATVRVGNDFQSVRNGSGVGGGFFGEYAVDTIAVGGTVTWEWIGLDHHNVTPYQNSAFSASGTHGAPFILGPITFNARGTYRYRCTRHSQENLYLGLLGARGVIVVR